MDNNPSRPKSKTSQNQIDYITTSQDQGQRPKPKTKTKTKKAHLNQNNCTQSTHRSQTTPHLVTPAFTPPKTTQKQKSEREVWEDKRVWKDKIYFYLNLVWPCLISDFVLTDTACYSICIQFVSYWHCLLQHMHTICFVLALPATAYAYNLFRIDTACYSICVLSLGVIIPRNLLACILTA